MSKESVESELEARFSQAAITGQQFAERLLRSGVIHKDLLQNAWRELQQGQRSAAHLADRLIAKRELTPFQAISAVDQDKPLLKLGAYVLVDRLGEGGMGQVYRAIHQKMKREVAIKVISTKVLKDENAIRRFGREVEAAARLSHPNIVTSHDAGEVDGVHYLVMESVSGKDLSAIVREKGRLPLQKSIECILQAARGLAYAHHQGITHRDIKPANMLLDHQGVLKILDMGLARIEQESDASVADGLTGTGMVMGTIDYMAPEQAFDSKVADSRSDIYSLGCTLYFLLTGQSVYGGDTVLKRILAHRDQPIPNLRQRLPNAPAELQTVFEKMVAKRPEHRFKTLDEAIPRLEEILVALPATAEGTNVDSRGKSAAFEGTVALDAPLAETYVSPTINLPEMNSKAGYAETLVPNASLTAVSPSIAVPSTPAAPPTPASTAESFSIRIDAQPPKRARVPRSATPMDATPRVGSSAARAKIAISGCVVAMLLGMAYWLLMPQSSSPVASNSAPSINPAETMNIQAQGPDSREVDSNSVSQGISLEAPNNSLGRSLTELDFDAQVEEMGNDSISMSPLNSETSTDSTSELGLAIPSEVGVMPVGSSASDAIIPLNDVLPSSTMNGEGEAVQGGRTLIVGTGPDEIATLDDALNVARPNDKILIVLAMGLKPSPSGETFRFFRSPDAVRIVGHGELPDKLA